MELNPDEMKKSGSRFQVARVETKEDQARECHINEHLELNETNSRLRTEGSPRKIPNLSNIDTTNIIHDSGSDGRPTSNGLESPCATFSLSGDSIPSRTWSSAEGYNKTNCVMNTIEALPCVDHYRNMFSATAGGNLKARPTLAELHEEMVM